MEMQHFVTGLNLAVVKVFEERLPALLEVELAKQLETLVNAKMTRLETFITEQSDKLDARIMQLQKRMGELGERQDFADKQVKSMSKVFDSMEEWMANMEKQKTIDDKGCQERFANFEKKFATKMKPLMVKFAEWCESAFGKNNDEFGRDVDDLETARRLDYIEREGEVPIETPPSTFAKQILSDPLELPLQSFSSNSNSTLTRFGDVEDHDEDDINSSISVSNVRSLSTSMVYTRKRKRQRYDNEDDKSERGDEGEGGDYDEENDDQELGGEDDDLFEEQGVAVFNVECDIEPFYETTTTDNPDFDGNQSGRKIHDTSVRFSSLGKLLLRRKGPPLRLT
ncbi:uncharacterized protein LOC110855418 isoform X1 [Folsomia candida]|uniref:uncharacterized protein LOC110855418 isoform X1 n=1 Tax=Folsomia candida TaxID=158441 RepID=UPI001604D4AB|nr:uncharacterized protein LOC110855418 isoform X1 [Folsomia candida]